jgi:hypothetical protein
MPYYGKGENKESMKGMAKVKPSAGSGTIRSEEHVGGSGAGTHKFRMPKDSEVADHSNLDTPEHKRA